MALTPSEVEQINTALSTLGRSLKAEIAKLPAKGRPADWDDAFLNKVREHYLSDDKGILALLADARLTQGASCVCSCTCGSPGQGPVTW